MLILGIDPSSTRIGVALIEYLDSGVTLIRCESFRVNYKDDTLVDRVDEIEDTLGKFLTGIVPPRKVCIERPVIGPVQSRHGVVTQCACYGAILALVRRSFQRRSDVVQVLPTVVKKLFTGKGNATKDDVVACVVAQFNVNPQDHDAADAVAIAVAGHMKGGEA